MENGGVRNTFKILSAINCVYRAPRKIKSQNSPLILIRLTVTLVASFLLAIAILLKHPFLSKSTSETLSLSYHNHHWAVFHTKGHLLLITCLSNIVPNDQKKLISTKKREKKLSF